MTIVLIAIVVVTSMMVGSWIGRVAHVTSLRYHRVRRDASRLFALVRVLAVIIAMIGVVVAIGISSAGGFR